MADALQSKTDFRKKEDKTSRNRGKVWNGHSVNKDKSRLFKTARQAEWVRMITDKKENNMLDEGKSMTTAVIPCIFPSLFKLSSVSDNLN